MKVTLRSGTIKAASSCAKLGKTKLERLKEKWSKQKELKVFPPKERKDG